LRPNASKLKTAVELLTLRRLMDDGEVSEVQKLLHSSPNLATTPFDDGSLPLHVAAGRDEPDIVEILVRAGAPFGSKYGKSAHSALS
jgi:ankyrin repeat protein